MSKAVVFIFSRLFPPNLCLRQANGKPVAQADRTARAAPWPFAIVFAKCGPGVGATNFAASQRPPPLMTQY